MVEAKGKKGKNRTVKIIFLETHAFYFYRQYLFSFWIHFYTEKLILLL